MANSTFVIGATTATFRALIADHEDKGGAIREFRCGVDFASETEWNNLRSLQNWKIDVVPIPWGNTAEVVVQGGPGAGTLTIPGFAAPFTAYLTEATRQRILPNGRSFGRATFLITA